MPLRLSRRRALQIGAAGILGAVAAPAFRTSGTFAASPPTTIVEPITTGWLFGGRYREGSLDRTYDDTRFLPVTLPHCVTALAAWNWDPQAWENTYIYRYHFDLPESGSGRLFVTFDGVMVKATTAINGHRLGVHLGGYLPFQYELTPYVQAKDNVLAVQVDAQWLNVPPEGAWTGPRSIDFLQPGGIYRGVTLRWVPPTFIADIFARPVDVLTTSCYVVLVCTIDAASAVDGAVIVASLHSSAGGQALASASVSANVPRGRSEVTLRLEDLGNLLLWSPESPTLYAISVQLRIRGATTHSTQVRIGFRQADFQVDGFFLNGKRYKLFGLDRHQIYPYTGMAMPARVQRRDAAILKYELHCNMVRCSHYPQSADFLDACDELGILVWEETPGWQFIGDADWQALVLQDVADMVTRDRNRPSVIIWGTRINEAPNRIALWATTRQLCYQLDGSRPSSGAMATHSVKDWAEDVFAFNDYTHHGTVAGLQPPVSNVPYLVTEAVGAIDPPHYYTRFASQHDLQQQALLHGEVHSRAGRENRYAGVLAWCAFDYDSLNGYTQEHLKWAGVADTFRIPKPGAAIYRAQVPPSWKPVIEPSFDWNFGPPSPVTTLGQRAAIWTNCDHIDAYLDGQYLTRLTPATADFPGLAHPPMYLDVSQIDGSVLPELRLDGYVGLDLVLSRTFSSDPSSDRLQVVADDTQITADGSDMTRIVVQAVDHYGTPRPYPTGEVQLSVHGPGTPVGPASLDFSALGGAGAIWIRSVAGSQGLITVTATHPVLGSGSATVLATAMAPLTPQVFSDVPPTYWAAAAIEALSSHGIVAGSGDGTFQPDAPVTRAEFVKMLDLTIGLPPGSGELPFHDVPRAAWFFPYVAAAVRAQIIEGISPNEFAPNASLSRQELATILARALHLTSTTRLPFTDQGSIAAWARSAVEEAVAAGYLNGLPNGTFDPLGDTTRAEAAKVLASVLAVRTTGVPSA